MRSLAALFDTFKAAVFGKDLETFCSLYDDNVRIFDMWQQWSYEGLPAWREMAKGWLSSLGTDSDVVTFDDIQIRENDELAVATAIIRFTAVSAEGSELRYLEERLTWVAEKKKGAWKIVHQHTSTPIDLNSMKAILAR